MKISITNSDGIVTYQESLSSKLPSQKTDETTASSASASSNTTGSNPAELAKKATFQSALDSASASNSSKAASLSNSAKMTPIAERLETVKSYKEIFQEASDYFCIDINLLEAMAQKESEFNPNAKSAGGAMGIMQLMPATAEYLGVTDPYDPYQNIMGGARYISEMIGQFNGNVDLALAAYNAGSGTVAAYGGIPPKAQSYVDKIHAIMSAGPEVPNRNYIDKNATKEEKVADLMTLIADLPDTEEFADIRNKLAEMNYI